MAEGMAKKFYRNRFYLQSVGVENDQEIDGFAIAACAEIGVALERHRTRSFDEMLGHGDDLTGFDLMIALSPVSHLRAHELARVAHLDVEYWPIFDPTGHGETRHAKLDAYRKTRDQLRAHLVARFGPPDAPLPRIAIHRRRPRR